MQPIDIQHEKNGVLSCAGNLHYIKSVYFTNIRSIIEMHSSKSIKSSKRYLSILAVALSGDTELNPCPKAPNWPCGTCDKAVTWKQKALCCDTCNIWYHTNCQGMSSNVYQYMDSSNLSWNCIQCGMPNFSSSIYDLSSLETSNSFSHLTEESLSSPGLPKATSSPKKRYMCKKNNKKVKVLNINVQSIKSKRSEIDEILTSVKPDIIIGTETWLNNIISSYEYFPPSDYTVFRKDREQNVKNQS